jgi:hypothetical protein
MRSGCRYTLGQLGVASPLSSAVGSLDGARGRSEEGLGRGSSSPLSSASFCQRELCILVTPRSARLVTPRY